MQNGLARPEPRQKCRGFFVAPDEAFKVSIVISKNLEGLLEKP